MCVCCVCVCVYAWVSVCVCLGGKCRGVRNLANMPAACKLWVWILSKANVNVWESQEETKEQNLISMSVFRRSHPFSSHDQRCVYVFTCCTHELDLDLCVCVCVRSLHHRRGRRSAWGVMRSNEWDYSLKKKINNSLEPSGLNLNTTDRTSPLPCLASSQPCHGHITAASQPHPSHISTHPHLPLLPASWISVCKGFSAMHQTQPIGLLY